ncbi:hypothetical protein DSO57_1009238 [Entomophthora muscae]|uniref:Uncharacterized protein n=1 Tax=Entomophthora muscae TaxID=34485 RepID=A0ACC2THU5_9FUNG|nr:hypothetical protein DSO57_1009238 [Entomophthora muscae]
MSSTPPNVGEKAGVANSTKPKIFIIFYTTYLHVYKLALAIQKGIEAEGRCEVHIFQLAETLSVEALKKIRAPPKPDVPIITPQLLTEADGVLFGFPTRYGTLPAQLKEFLDACGRLWADGSLNGKMTGAFVSTATQHGGQETSIFTLVSSLVHFGMLYVPLGYASPHLKEEDVVCGGSPWGATVSAGKDGTRQPSEQELETAEIQGREFSRTVERYSLSVVPTVAKEAEKQAILVGSGINAEEAIEASLTSAGVENPPEIPHYDVIDHGDQFMLLSNDNQNPSLENDEVEPSRESFDVNTKEGSPYFKGLGTLASFSFEANHFDLGKDSLSLPPASLAFTPEKEEEAVATEEIQGSPSTMKVDEAVSYDTTLPSQDPIPTDDLAKEILSKIATTKAAVDATSPVDSGENYEEIISPVTAYEEAEREVTPVTAHEEVGEVTENVTPVTAPEEAAEETEMVVSQTIVPTAEVAIENGIPKVNDLAADLEKSTSQVTVTAETAPQTTNDITEETPASDKADALKPIVAGSAAIEEVISPDVEARGLMASQAFNDATPIESPIEPRAEAEVKPQVSPQERAVQKMPSLLDITIPSTATEASGLSKKASQPIMPNEEASDAKALASNPLKTTPAQSTAHTRKHSFAKASATNLRKFFKSFSVRSKHNDMA